MPRHNPSRPMAPPPMLAPSSAWLLVSARKTSTAPVQVAKMMMAIRTRIATTQPRARPWQAHWSHAASDLRQTASAERQFGVPAENRVEDFVPVPSSSNP